MKLDFSNGQQFKAKVRNKASENNVDPQILMQEIVLDEVLERISKSKYKDNLILKGGFLIASILGIDTRSTRDIDTSITGLDMTEQIVSSVFKEICNSEYPSDISLKIMGIKNIRESNLYPGFRIHIQGIVFSSRVDIKVDISAGDKITPKQIEYRHHLLFNDSVVTVMSYNIETIIAEKIETIVTRREPNTRLKDYYDLYMFDCLDKNQIDFGILRKAICVTIENRNANVKIDEIQDIVVKLSTSKVLERKWIKYQKSNSYSGKISFEDTCKAALDLIQEALYDRHEMN